VQSAALNEGRIAQHESAFEVLREKQGAREILKEQAKLARRQRIEPALLLVASF
jgi:GH24 family phage-related lysozyme (muramidase)